MSRPSFPQALVLATVLFLAGTATAAASCPAFLNHEFKKLLGSDVAPDSAQLTTAIEKLLN